MFCRKCGSTIPEDSNFCPKCGTCNNIDIESDDSAKVNLKKPGSQSAAQGNIQNRSNNQNNGVSDQNYNAPVDPSLKCPKCGKAILPTWTKCMYCGAFNPFNPDIQPTANTTIITPPPQVIIKEERVVVHETPKEEKGCGTIVGEIIGWIIFISFLIGFLQSCFSCAG